MDESVTWRLIELSHSLNTYKHQTQLLAHRYLELGQTWHKLPFQLRWHSKLYPSIMDYCTKAVTVTSRRELPTFITLLGTLAPACERAEGALERGDMAMAEAMLNAIWSLLGEIVEGVTDLGYCLETMETLREICELEGQAKWWDEAYRSGSKMREAWWNALPAICFEVEDEETEEDRAYEAEDERGEASTEGWDESESR